MSEYHLILTLLLDSFIDFGSVAGRLPGKRGKQLIEILTTKRAATGAVVRDLVFWNYIYN